MRDDGFARVGTQGPEYFLDSIEDKVNENIFRWVAVVCIEGDKNVKVCLCNCRFFLGPPIDVIMYL